MLRHRRLLPRLCLAAMLAATLAGCGIKGPLTLPPDNEKAQDAPKPAPRTEPRL